MTSRWRGQTLAATVLFVALTVALTWPQALVLATHAREHHDVYFNMWRLAWMFHALGNPRAGLFEGNIFYPEQRTLTFSDAMVVEGLVAAPLFAAGLPPVLIHNLLLLGAMVASATGLFVLARHLTGSPAAGIVAGVIFAFVPFRFEHYMHMEMQWTMWTPWAFWAMHRTFETRSWRHGVMTGLFVSLQMLSSIYYGVFLIVLLGLVTALLLLAERLRDQPVLAARLAPAALVVIVICGAYALPYLETKKHVGGRGVKEVMLYSARPSSYLVATPDNVVYGEMFAGRGRPERRLFPGALAVALALVGLLTRPNGKEPLTIAYLLGMVLAYEMSLGFSGYSFPFLSERSSVFAGFRAIARLGIFVVFFLAVLAAWGYAAIASTRGMPRRALLASAIALLVVEYRVRPLSLIRYPNQPYPLHAWLATQPRGVVATLPMPDDVPGTDPRVAYLSTFHWQPIVNGYSGFAPQSYLDRIDDVRGFPDEKSIERLRRDGVRYLVVQLWWYRRDDRTFVLDALRLRYGFRELGRFYDGNGDSAVFLLS